MNVRQRMNENDTPSPGATIKYILLQIPALIAFVIILFLVRKWLKPPDYLLWILFFVWVGKDIILFPFLWRYYDVKKFPDRFQMVGRKGLALTRLYPDGYVQINGERWQAENINKKTPIEKGDTIYVEAINGLKLKIVPFPARSVRK